MKKLRQMISLLIASCLICGTMVHAKSAEISAEKNLLYERMLEAYLNGKAMEDWAVEARKQIAEERGLLEYLDDRSFLSVEYRNENDIGRDGEITDPELNLLVEIATNEEADAILMKSQIQTLDTRSITSGQSVGVTQMARVSGAGNGYFTVSGANSYGYCAQNSYDFWSNNVTKYGTAYEWNDATVRKVLYYGPGGPGYAGPYYGSLGADMDYVTFAVGKLNGDTANNTKSTAYINFVSGKADPLSSGYKAYKADIASPYQDVAFLSYSPVTTTLTIEKRSQTDLYSGDGYKYLTGVIFDLYSFNGSSFNALVSTAVDNGNGSYTFHNVPTTSYNGMYLVKERVAKAGYQNRYYLNDIYDETDYNVWGGRVFQLNTSNYTWSCASLGHFPYPGWGFTFLDYPNNVTVTITKKDSETGEKLTGAAFELWAYRGGNVASDSGNPEYSYKVGDFQDNQDGTYSLTFPFDLATLLGSNYWFMYKETKAPDGYEKDAWAASGYGISFDRNGNGTTEFVVENKPLPRVDIVKKQEGTDVVIPDVVFEHKKPDGTTETLSTDENGQLRFKSLEAGEHEIREISVMEGYLLNENVITFSVGTDNEVTITSDPDDSKGRVELQVINNRIIEMTMYDKTVPYDLVICKENNQGKTLEGAEFALYLDGACTNVIQTGVSDADGKIKFEGLLNGTKYYLKETKAPTGYCVPADENGNPIVTEIEVSNIPARGEFALYVDGAVYDFETEGAFTFTGTKAAPEVTMAAVNEIGYLLPQTGSAVTLFSTLAGELLFVISIKNQLKRKEK